MAENKDKLKDFVWIIKCILSCTTNTQLYTCYDLMSLFNKKHSGVSEMIDYLIEIVNIQKTKVVLL